MVFGVHYNTAAWTWAVPEEKLAGICNMLRNAIDSDTVEPKTMKSLTGKLIHVKPLVPAGRFNIDKIMKVYAAAA